MFNRKLIKKLEDQIDKLEDRIIRLEDKIEDEPRFSFYDYTYRSYGCFSIRQTFLVRDALDLILNKLGMKFEITPSKDTVLTIVEKEGKKSET